MGRHLTGPQVVELLDLFDSKGVWCWAMGGWGIDALVGRATREHKDLDLFVHVSSLRAYSETVEKHGFARKLEWSENRPLILGEAAFDSAFVDAHPDGREIDVHVIDTDQLGRVLPLHDDPWPLPDDALTGDGRIAKRPVRCVSPAAQHAMHSNYDLPVKHLHDIRLLKAAFD